GEGACAIVHVTRSSSCLWCHCEHHPPGAFSALCREIERLMKAAGDLRHPRKSVRLNPRKTLRLGGREHAQAIPLADSCNAATNYRRWMPFGVVNAEARYPRLRSAVLAGE